MFKFILREKAILHSTILFIVGVFVVLAFAPYAYANVDFSWAKKFGGTSVDYGYSISVDSSGNVYTTGIFLGTVDFDPGAGTSNLTSGGSEDLFISKLDSSGNFLWAKKIGGGSSEYGYSNTVDSSGNVYVTGFFTGGTVDFDPGAGTSNLVSAGNNDIFVLKLNSNGDFVWAKNMGGVNNDQGNSIKVDSSGNVYTTGYFSSTADFDPGAGTSNLVATAASADIFISKLDSSGNFVWAKAMVGGSATDYGNSISVDSSGNVYTTGVFVNTVDFDPGAGTSNLTSYGSGNMDSFISKLDSSGNFVWAKKLSGSSTDYANSITLDSSTNIYITGYFYGTLDADPGAGTSNLTSSAVDDIFVTKFNSNGDLTWAKSIGSTGSQVGYSISVDSSGNVYTTGVFTNTVDFDPGAGTSSLTSAGTEDIFISKLNSSGNFVWAGRAGSTGTDYGNSVSLDSSGNPHITGYFTGTVDFDPGAGTSNLASAGNVDIFVLKMSIDTTAPTITNVSSDKTNGSYTTGEVIDIDVTFSEAVTSTGNVTVTLETGTTDRTCTFSVSNSTTGTCNYTVQAGDTTSDLTVNTISGTIADQASNAMSNFAPATNLASNKALVIDTTAPTISEVTPVSTPTNDTTPNYTFTTNEAGSLTYGGSCSSATTTATLGSNTITFNALTAGTYSNCTITVTDVSTNASSPLSVSSFVIDTTAPTITNVSSDKTNGSYTTGEVIDIDVTFSEAVTSTGNVTVTLETGTTDRTCTFSVSNSTTGTCNYTVQAGDTTSDLTVNTISGTIADQASNAMSNFAPATNLASNKALVIDTTAPTISEVTPVSTPTNDTTPNYTFTTNEAGSLTYGGSCSSATTTATLGSNTITFNALTAGTYSNCTITVTDVSTNASSPLSVSSFVIDTTAPGIIQYGVTPSTTTALVTWETNENSSSIVDYGVTNSYETSTVETDTSPRVTSHSVSLSSLVSCTTYFVQVRSRDSALNSVSNQTFFTTTGCVGNASILNSNLAIISDATGGTRSLSTGIGVGIDLNIPAGSVADDASFQIKQLDTSNTLLSIGVPSGVVSASNHIYDLKALTDVNTAVTSFNNPITTTLTYLDSDITGIIESSLLIYRWNGLIWSPLVDCVVDSVLNTITCTTTNFSVFGLFGTSNVVASSSAPAGAVSVDFLQKLSDRLRKESSKNNIVAVTKEEKKEEKKCGTLPENSKILKLNTKHVNVKTLQQILNCKGYTISVSGVGSPGKETTLFGGKTREAVIRFQKDNGLKADGVLGSLSRKILSQ